MKVVYHPRFREVYSGDPAAEPGRMEAIYRELKDLPWIEWVEPGPAAKEDILLVHTQDHVDHVKGMGLTYEIALLSAGGAIKASEIALHEPAFGLIRPPGHHASPSSAWGFCFFNNIAISITKLRKEGKIDKALILDIDLHCGDGTENIFAPTSDISYFHLPDGGRSQQLKSLEEYLASEANYDILAVSAGFDRHERDWGGALKTDDYRTIGQFIKDASVKCNGRRYAVLEGGYNHQVLGANVLALLKGLE